MRTAAPVAELERPLQRQGGCLRYLLAAFAIAMVPVGGALCFCLSR